MNASLKMDANQIHECARRFVEVHGDKAEAQAALRTQRFEQLKDKEQAEIWRRIRVHDPRVAARPSKLESFQLRARLREPPKCDIQCLCRERPPCGTGNTH